MLRVARFKMGNSLDRCCSCNDGASAKFPPKKLEPLRSQADQMMHVRPLPDFVKACHRLMNVRCLADVEPGGAPCAATLWTPPSPFPVQGAERSETKGNDPVTWAGGMGEEGVTSYTIHPSPASTPRDIKKNCTLLAGGGLERCFK
jgi:hypothetical protein